MIGSSVQHSVSPVTEFFRPMSRDDCAGVGLVECFAVLGVHLVDSGHDFLLAVSRIEDAGALLERAGVDAAVGQVTVRVRDDLEDQAGERGIRVAGS